MRKKVCALTFLILACLIEVSARAQSPVLPASWTTPAWCIDPQNVSTCASDLNTGTTCVCGTGNAGPLLTWHQLNDVRWACRGAVNCPRFLQVTTITWLSSGPVGDMMYFHPANEAATSVILTTPLPTPRCSGTLTGVLSIVRTAGSGQLTNATLCAGVAVGDLVVNTTHPSRTHIFANVSGTTWALDSPLVPAVVPFIGFAIPAEVAWANGDAYIDYPAPPTIWAAVIEPISTPQSIGAPFGATVVAYQLGFSSNQFDKLRVNDGFAAFDSIIAPIVDIEDNGGVTYPLFFNTQFNGGLVGGLSFDLTKTLRLIVDGGQIGQRGVMSETQLEGAALDNDTIVTGGSAGGDGCHAMVQPMIRSLEFGTVYLDTSTVIEGDRTWSGWHSGQSGNHILWGPGGWSLWGSGHLGYETASAFQNTGPMQLSCLTNACNGGTTVSFGTTMLPTACNIAITAANIATNGTLWVPGGASLAPNP
jgi:hypothetical protein